MARKASSRTTAKNATNGSGGARKGTSTGKTAAQADAAPRVRRKRTRSAATQIDQAKPKPAAKEASKVRLTKAELEDFRNMLLEKRRSLVGDMNGIEAEALGTNRQDGTGDLSSMPTHPADLGTDNYEQEFTLGLLESERQMLTEIDEALQRLRKGTFGICMGTGKPISKARLRARPWAKYSIEYARMIEKGLVRPGDEADDGSNGDEADGGSNGDDL